MRPEIWTRHLRSQERITGAVMTSPLPFFDQQNGHALADVLACDITENAGSGGVQREMYRRFVGLPVEAGCASVRRSP